jgi:microcystin-dependent protein
MSTPFIGQLSLFSFGFAPKGWAQCNGQLLQINTNQALFSVLGTFYGGNGVNTFGLPNLQGRTPISMSDSYPIGSSAGEPAHTLTGSEVPPHSHSANAATTGANSTNPANALLSGGGTAVYVPAANMTPMNNTTAIANYGGGQPHENRQPYLVLNWCIALVGIFPSRS